MTNSPWLKALFNGATVVTPNANLARRLRALHRDINREQGLNVWTSPDILPLAAWLRRAWLALAPLADSQLLLRPLQEQALWYQVVTGSNVARELLRTAEATRGAAAAWQLCHSYRLGDPERWPGLNNDTRVFVDWQRRYRGYLRDNGWIDSAQLADSLVRLDLAPLCGLRLALTGFDALTPQQQALLDGLAKAGVELTLVPAPPARRSRVRRVGLTDQALEFQSCAAWTAHQVESQQRSVGVIVPLRGGFERRLIAAFSNQLGWSEISHAPAYCDFSVALLADHPLIEAAFAGLDLARRSVSLDQLGILLMAPSFAGYRSEQLARAELLAELRQNGEQEIANRELRQWLAGGFASRWRERCGIFFEHIMGALDLTSAAPERMLPSQWSRLFGQLLRALGWTREWEAQPAEQQYIKGWHELLREFAQLDRVLSAQDVSAALGSLRTSARSRPVQLPDAPSPVQIISAAEAHGQRFDQLWVLGVDDHSWPRGARSDPFIPLAVQRAAGIPHASTQSQQRHDLSLLTELLSSAHEVLLSYPLAEGQEPRRPSPMIRHLPECSPSELPGTRCFRSVMFASGRREQVSDRVVPLRLGQSLRGGASLLRDQAACPFRAFARYRLGARGPEAAGMGMEAIERGSTAHHALEKFWRTLRSQAALMAATDEELNEFIATVVDAQQVRRLASGIGDRSAFIALEKDRLCKVLRAWCEVERQRPPFTVEAVEADAQIEVGGLRLQLRLDRIDVDADGRRLLIDYKTGNVDLNAWAGERPDDPQLPLYAAFAAPDVQGVLFACLHPREAAYKGCGVAGIDIAGLRVVEDWHDRLQAWRDLLDSLAASFRDGAAAVDPKQYPHTCTYCDLRSLCRIHERLPGVQV
jgi:ATP-dependent helicase/nuclease subunit B